MRNLHLLPVPDETKLEIEHNASLYRSLYGVQVDILEMGSDFAIVRLLHVENVNGKVYTQKELIGFGLEILAPVKESGIVWHWRPLVFDRPPKRY